jgi:hypothetical protein
VNLSSVAACCDGQQHNVTRQRHGQVNIIRGVWRQPPKSLSTCVQVMGSGSVTFAEYDLSSTTGSAARIHVLDRRRGCSRRSSDCLGKERTAHDIGS